MPRSNRRNNHRSSDNHNNSNSRSNIGSLAAKGRQIAEISNQLLAAPDADREFPTLAEADRLTLVSATSGSKQPAATEEPTRQDAGTTAHGGSTARLNSNDEHSRPTTNSVSAKHEHLIGDDDPQLALRRAPRDLNNNNNSNTTGYCGTSESGLLGGELEGGAVLGGGASCVELLSTRAANSGGPEKSTCVISMDGGPAKELTTKTPTPSTCTPSATTTATSTVSASASAITTITSSSRLQTREYLVESVPTLGESVDKSSVEARSPGGSTGESKANIPAYSSIFTPSIATGYRSSASPGRSQQVTTTLTHTQHWARTGTGKDQSAGQAPHSRDTSASPTKPSPRLHVPLVKSAQLTGDRDHQAQLRPFDYLSKSSDRAKLDFLDQAPADEDYDDDEETEIDETLPFSASLSKQFRVSDRELSNKKRISAIMDSTAHAPGGAVAVKKGANGDRGKLLRSERSAPTLSQQTPANKSGGGNPQTKISFGDSVRPPMFYSDNDFDEKKLEWQGCKRCECKECRRKQMAAFDKKVQEAKNYSRTKSLHLILKSIILFLLTLLLIILLLGILVAGHYLPLVFDRILSASRTFNVTIAG